MPDIGDVFPEEEEGEVEPPDSVAADFDAFKKVATALLPS